MLSKFFRMGIVSDVAGLVVLGVQVQWHWECKFGGIRSAGLVVLGAWVWWR